MFAVALFLSFYHTPVLFLSNSYLLNYPNLSPFWVFALVLLSKSFALLRSVFLCYRELSARIGFQEFKFSVPFWGIRFVFYAFENIVLDVLRRLLCLLIRGTLDLYPLVTVSRFLFSFWTKFNCFYIKFYYSFFFLFWSGYSAPKVLNIGSLEDDV